MAWKSSCFAPDTTQCLTEATALPVAFIVNNAVQLKAQELVFQYLIPI